MKKTKQSTFNYEMCPQDSKITFRLSEKLHKALRSKAKKLGVKEHKVIRLAIEFFINSS